jgi:hypothetical protein
MTDAELVKTVEQQQLAIETSLGIFPESVSQHLVQVFLGKPA